MKILLRVIAALVSASSLTVVAAPKIEFNGEVNAQTCTPVINGETEGVILLPVVSIASLATSGNTTGKTNFTISVTGCTAVPATAEVTEDKISTIFLGHNVTPNGYLGNLATTSPATNVALQLLRNDGTAITLNGLTSVPGLVLKRGQTSAKHDFGVQYIATGVATAGKVKGVVEYGLSYF